MQLLAMIASFIFGRMNKNTQGLGIKETAREIFEDAILKGRKPVILVLTGLSAVIFFCGGLFITILEGTSQYDRVGYVTLTSTMGAGIILFCLAAIGFTYVFAFAWPGATRQIKEVVHTKEQHQASSLEQALTVLVLDFVKDREVRRQQQAANPVPPTVRPTPAAPSATDTNLRDNSAPIH